MHDHDGKGNKSMMWMMAICCGLPLLLILFVGGGGKALGTSTWVVFGGMAVMILAHFFMMGKHKHGDDSNEKQELIGKEGKNKEDKTHSGHGCCH
jgi:membrane protein implicated in regulation of membrane protease activity